MAKKYPNRGIYIFVFLISFLAIARIGVSEEILDPLQLKNLGDNHYHRLEFDLARDAYEKSLLAFPKDVDERSKIPIRRTLAVCYYELLEIEKSRKQLQIIMDYLVENNWQDNAPELYTGIAEAELLLNNPQKAFHLLESYPFEASKNLEQNAKALRFMILAQERMGNTHKAKELLLEAKKRLPKELWRKTFAGENERLVLAEELRPSVFWYGVCIVLTFVFLLFLFFVNKNIFLITSTVLICILVTGIFLKIFFPVPNEVSHFLNNPNQVTELRLNGELSGDSESKVTHFTVNGAGIRGFELPGKFFPRILSMGGSSVEQLYIDDTDTWQMILEKNLNNHFNKRIWVGNAGRSGATTPIHIVQTRVFLEEINPEIIILQAGINDMNMCITNLRKDLYYNSLKAQHPDYIYEFNNEIFSYTSPLGRKTGMTYLYYFWLVSKSLKNKWDSFLSIQVTDNDSVIQNIGGDYIFEQREKRKKAQKINEIPDIEFCLDLFRKNLSLIVELSNAAGTRVVLLTQGSLYRKDIDPIENEMLWMGSIDQGFFSPIIPKKYYTVDVLAELINQYNQTTLDVCKKYDLTCLDVDSVVPKTAEYYYDDVHLKSKGGRTMGQIISEFFISNKNLNFN